MITRIFLLIFVISCMISWHPLRMLNVILKLMVKKIRQCKTLHNVKTRETLIILPHRTGTNKICSNSYIKRKNTHPSTILVAKIETTNNIKTVKTLQLNMFQRSFITFSEPMRFT